MGYTAVQTRAALDHLDIFGGLHPDDGGTILMLGPQEPGFWTHFTGSDEYRDGAANPMDRWSTRVLSAIAADLGATPCFPFTGPPYHPFIAWAQATGRAWPSPVGMLVHERAGLFASYRGALQFATHIALPETPTKPCDSCTSAPCTTSCPVDALGPDGYDVDACHGYLDTAPGQDCLTQGCKARRACPVSQSYGRLPEQSAFHMSYFHK